MPISEKFSPAWIKFFNNIYQVAPKVELLRSKKKKKTLMLKKKLKNQIDKFFKPAELYIPKMFDI